MFCFLFVDVCSSVSMNIHICHFTTSFNTFCYWMTTPGGLLATTNTPRIGLWVNRHCRLHTTPGQSDHSVQCGLRAHNMWPHSVALNVGPKVWHTSVAHNMWPHTRLRYRVVSPDTRFRGSFWTTSQD